MAGRGGKRPGAGRKKGSTAKKTNTGIGASGRDSFGRFASGNRFWEARSSAGPKPIFATPDQLWTACCEYFEWVENNPLWEDRIVSFQGVTKHEPVAKMRAMTLAGLCVFLDISRVTWKEWRESRPDLSNVMARAEEIIAQQKFSGAAADLLNANIIARDLGLTDKSEFAEKDTPLTIRIIGGLPKDDDGA